MKKFILLFCLITSFANAENLKLSLGEYEMIIKNKLSNLPRNLPPAALEALNKTNIQRVCIKDNSNKWFVNNVANNPNCTIEKIEQKGNKVTWNGKCPGNFQITLAGGVTLSKDSFLGENTTTAKMPNGQELKATTEYNAHRLGPCK